MTRQPAHWENTPRMCGMSNSQSNRCPPMALFTPVFMRRPNDTLNALFPGNDTSVCVNSSPPVYRLTASPNSCVP